MLENIKKRKSLNNTLEVIEDWVNETTEDGFTCLHFAA